MKSSKPSAPPTLTRRLLADRLKRLAPEFPAELVQVASREIIAALTEALAAGRPVTLRGFGRFEVRRYRGPAKRLGLVFRPSPGLVARLNPADAVEAGPDDQP